MPALPGDPPAARALDELRRAARAAHELQADATAVLDLDLGRAGHALGRGVWAGVRTAVLMGAILLAGIVGGVLVCIGASGLVAASLQLGPEATLLFEGSALLACSALAAGTAWLMRRRRQAALAARRRAAREALATSAKNLVDAVANATDPRPWLEEHPLAGLAAALVAGLAAGRAAGRRNGRSPQPSAAPPEAAPAGPAEARAGGPDVAAELAALVLSLGVPLIERLLQGAAASGDEND